MKPCPYCGYSNLDTATQCRKCDGPFDFDQRRATLYKRYLIGPIKAHEIRRKALTMLVIGLLIKVYWGGFGPWPTIDNPTLVGLRSWLEPLLLYGGASLYGLGWIANWI